MPRRRRKRERKTREAVDRAAGAAWAFELPEPLTRRRDPLGLVLARDPVKVARSAGTAVLLERKPRQLALGDVRRQEILRSMELAFGRPIGRRTREKLKGLVPEIVHSTLCGKKRQRRSVMFANGAAGIGKRAAARKPRQHKMGRC